MKRASSFKLANALAIIFTGLLCSCLPETDCQDSKYFYEAFADTASYQALTITSLSEAGTYKDYYDGLEEGDNGYILFESVNIDPTIKHCVVRRLEEEGLIMIYVEPDGKMNTRSGLNVYVDERLLHDEPAKNLRYFSFPDEEFLKSIQDNP